MKKKIVLLFVLALYFVSVQSSVFAQEQVCEQTSADFTPYAEALPNKIMNNWHPQSKKKNLDATVLLSVDKDGTIQNINILKSSNKKKFDYEIKDSIMNSVPLEPLPTNAQEEYKNIQLNFVYEKTEDKNAPKKYITASVKNQYGYDNYIEQVDKVVSAKLKEKCYFLKKDVLISMKINKSGKLLYAKMLNPSTKYGFVAKEFNRDILSTMHKTAFPPIPEKMGVNDITLDYRILTQRKRLFKNFITDYAINGFQTGLESFCVQNPPNI